MSETPSAQKMEQKSLVAKICRASCFQHKGELDIDQDDSRGTPGRTLRFGVEASVFEALQALESYKVIAPIKCGQWMQKIERQKSKLLRGKQKPLKKRSSWKQHRLGDHVAIALGHDGLPLPSQTDWHYLYHRGKTRAARRKELRKGIRNDLKALQAFQVKLTVQQQVHAERIEAFWKRAVRRQWNVKQKPTRIIKFTTEHLARQEAAHRIQQAYRLSYQVSGGNSLGRSRQNQLITLKPSSRENSSLQMPVVSVSVVSKQCVEAWVSLAKHEIAALVSDLTSKCAAKLVRKVFALQSLNEQH